VPTSSEFDARRLAYRVLLLQVLVGLVAALVCLVWGHKGFTSALTGAVTGVIANLYMTFRAVSPARSPQAALGRLYLGQFIKVVVTLGLFGVALLLYRRDQLMLGALLAGYVAVLVVSWTVPFVSLRRTAGGGPPAGTGAGGNA
jgi:F0F1-type ATP synthase assembly protein I